MANIEELLGDLLTEGRAWEEAKGELDIAEAKFELARTRLRVARDRFDLMFGRDAGGSWRELEGGMEDWLARVQAYQFVAEPIGKSARTVLNELKSATAEELADEMGRRGYEFHTPFPAREVHAAVVKQPWAKRNTKTDRWEIVPEK